MLGEHEDIRLAGTCVLLRDADDAGVAGHDVLSRRRSPVVVVVVVIPVARAHLMMMAAFAVAVC